MMAAPLIIKPMLGEARRLFFASVQQLTVTEENLYCDECGRMLRADRDRVDKGMCYYCWSGCHD